MPKMREKPDVDVAKVCFSVACHDVTVTKRGKENHCNGCVTTVAIRQNHIEAC